MDQNSILIANFGFNCAFMINTVNAFELVFIGYQSTIVMAICS